MASAVGWIGFAPMGKVLPPEAQRFLLGQAKVLSVSLLVALGLAALLGFLLARHLSRPVRALAATVAKLSDGQYDQRASVTGRDEIGRLAQAVNRLAETLEKNRTARRRWMADIAHELRTPVAILKGEIEALADGVRQPDGQKLSSLAEEVDQLAVLIEDLQTLALSDAGALNLHREPLEINALVQQVAEAFAERLAARGIDLELESARHDHIVRRPSAPAATGTQPAGKLRPLRHGRRLGQGRAGPHRIRRISQRGRQWTGRPLRAARTPV